MSIKIQYLRTALKVYHTINPKMDIVGFMKFTGASILVVGSVMAIITLIIAR